MARIAERRDVFYLVESFGGIIKYTYLSGIASGLFAARPSDLGLDDKGFLYYADDTDTLYEWDGGVWTDMVMGTLSAHASSHEDGGSDEISVGGLSGLLADAQTPLAHATSHRSGGSDAIKLDDLAAPDDNTDLNVSTSTHGLTPKLPNDATKFLDGTGNYTVPPATGPGGGAPDNADYVVETANGGLSAESVLGTTVITTTAKASQQAAAKAGRLFLPNNGFQLERDGGSAWAPWGPIFPLTPPVDADFSWINQGGASVTTTKGGIYLFGPKGAGENMRIRKKAAPSTPYTITVGFIPNMAIINSASIGIGFRQSSDGKTVDFMLQSSGNVLPFLVQKHSSPTAAAGALINNAVMPSASILWLQITDEGATGGSQRIYRFSMDGQNFIDVFAEGRTDYITADEVHFFVNALQATYDIGMTLLHWKET